MILVKDLNKKDIQDYKEFLDPEREKWLKEQASAYKDKKIVHINATPKGGGVAEILQSFVPLQKSLGLNSEWHVLEPDEKLFRITKKMHNSLQGGNEPLTEDEKNYYIECNKKFAGHIDELEPDVLIIHDPQPLASIQFLKNKVPAATRIHIDSTKPDPDTEKFVLPFINQYDKIIFTLKDFVPESVDKSKLMISPPAIDPLDPKNQYLEDSVCRAILITAGINPNKPLITQVSRFDKWKDPLGVIDAYYEAKNTIPDLQLILMGVMEASDDPEAMNVFMEVEKQAEGDPDIFLISQPDQLRDTAMDIYVNAIQRSSDIVLQKSLREGFGLTVTEAMWKEKPVIAGNTGGIKLQIQDGQNGFLVDSPKQASERIIQLLEDKGLSEKMGKNAKESVRNNFLITRLLEDEFKIMESIT